MASDDPDKYLGLTGDDAPSGGEASWFRDVRNAARVLTGWNLGIRGDLDPAAIAESRRAFVLVGLGLGIAAALVAWIADGLGLYVFGAAVFAAVTVTGLTNAKAEGGIAAAAADMTGATAGSDHRVAQIAGTVLAILLIRVAALTALAPLSTMLATFIAALVLSTSAMALASLAGRASDDEPLFSDQGSGQLWISGLAAILLAIVFIGFWTALLAALVSLLVGALIWACADLFGIKRDRNLLYTIRIKTELSVIITVVAVS